MTDRPRNLAPGYVRALGLLALLTGVLAMHILMFTPERMHHAGHAAAQSITAIFASHPADAGSAAIPMAARHDSTEPVAAQSPVMSTTRTPYCDGTLPTCRYPGVSSDRHQACFRPGSTSRLPRRRREIPAESMPE